MPSAASMMSCRWRREVPSCTMSPRGISLITASTIASYSASVSCKIFHGILHGLGRRAQRNGKNAEHFGATSASAFPPTPPKEPSPSIILQQR
eukprot:9737627-Alexandrium_andersonii.AAC.1